MSMNGIDVSAFQPSTITKLVGYDFVFVKATEGVGYVSGSCNAQIGSALAAGKLVGLYHFASGGNAVAEADFFVSNIAGYIGKAVLVLDMEANALQRGAGWAKTFLDRVKARTGVTPMIYGSRGNICNSAYAVVANSGYPLWVAAYPSPAPTTYGAHTPGNVAPWGGALVYQYSSSGHLPGYGASLDLDVAYINAAQWKALATKGGKVSVPAPTTATPAAPTSVGRNITSRPTKDIQSFVGVTADGIYGPDTTTAVRNWQSKHGLVADGIWGPASDAKAFGGTTGKPAVQVKPKPTAPKLVRIAEDGNRGTATNKLWQQVMGTPVDGVISNPSALIKADQHFLNSVVSSKDIKNLTGSSKLVEDGVNGAKTWAVRQFYLYNKYAGTVLNRKPTIGDFDGIEGPETDHLLQFALNRSAIGANKY